MQKLAHNSVHCIAAYAASFHLVLPLVCTRICMFTSFVYPNSVFVSGTIWSVWAFVSSQSLWVKLKASVSASQQHMLHAVPVWSLDATGSGRFQRAPGTCFLFNHFKKNKHLAVFLCWLSWRQRGPLFPIALHNWQILLKLLLARKYYFKSNNSLSTHGWVHLTCILIHYKHRHQEWPK